MARALDYTCQISNAVDHAHRHGVLHRDLRPSNVLVTDSGMLKVADFGTSRFLEIAAHGTTVIGSPPYMAPEQFHGKAVFASDIYSLGVTMYQMMTGVLPYDTPSPADLDRLMKGELLTAPRLKNPKIPKSINDVTPHDTAAADREVLLNSLDTQQRVVATSGNAGVVLVDDCHLSSWVEPAAELGAPGLGSAGGATAGAATAGGATAGAGLAAAEAGATGAAAAASGGGAAAVGIVLPQPLDGDLPALGMLEVTTHCVVRGHRQQIGALGVAAIARHQLVVGAAGAEHTALGKPDQRRRLTRDRS